METQVKVVNGSGIFVVSKRSPLPLITVLPSLSSPNYSLNQRALFCKLTVKVSRLRGVSRTKALGIAPSENYCHTLPKGN